MKKPCVIVFLLLAAETVFAQEPLIRADSEIYNALIAGTYDIRNKVIEVHSSSLNFDLFQTTFYNAYVNEITTDRDGRWTKGLPNRSIFDPLMARLAAFGTSTEDALNHLLPVETFLHYALIVCNDTHGIILYYIDNAAYPPAYNMGNKIVLTSRIYFEIKQR